MNISIGQYYESLFDEAIHEVVDIEEDLQGEKYYTLHRRGSVLVRTADEVEEGFVLLSFAGVGVCE